MWGGVCEGKMEGFPSGQREQTVNLSATPSEVQILPPPPYIMCGPFGSALYFILANSVLGYILYGRSDHCNSTIPNRLIEAGIAQLVEHQPSKLRVAGSRPVSRSIRFSEEKLLESSREENVGLYLEGKGF